jgi:hypothetical protein
MYSSFPRELIWRLASTIALFMMLAAPGTASAEEERAQFVIGEQHVVQSEILGAERSVWIRVPASYASSKDYRRYPVLYVLDGNLFFHPFTGVVRQLSTDVTPLIPEMIVVGIDSLDRLNDSTPTQSLIGPDGKDSPVWQASGGAEMFQHFLEAELIPYVDREFSTSDYRILAGYSLTGLPVAHNLLTRPDVFDSHIVLDGSIWWDQFYILDLAHQSIAEETFNHNQLVVVTTEQRYPAPYITVEAGGRELVNLLHDAAPTGLRISHIELEKETHHNLATIGLYRALTQVFEGHMITLDQLYARPDEIEPKFDALSARLGTRIAPPEGVLNFFGYQFLRNLPEQEPDKAILYFSMNTRFYPRSPNAWASLGQAYQDTGQIGEAYRAFSEALRLDPNNRKASEGLAGISPEG